MSSLNNALDVAKALLQDLHQCSNVKSETNSTANDTYVLDVNKWASLNFTFQVFFSHPLMHARQPHLLKPQQFLYRCPVRLSAQCNQ